MRLDFLLGIMAEALLILIAAKLVRDRICALRGHRVNALIVAARARRAPPSPRPATWWACCWAFWGR